MRNTGISNGNGGRPIDGSPLLTLHGTSVIQDGDETVVGDRADGRIRNSCGTIAIVAKENWTATSHATGMEFRLTPSGQITENLVLTLAPDGTMTLNGDLTVNGNVAASNLNSIVAAMPFVTHTVPSAVTTSGTVVFSSTIDAVRRLTKWIQSTYVATTNNSTNYWTIALQRVDSGANLATFTTAGDGTTNYARHDLGTLAIDLTTGMIGLHIRVTKTGGPGALTLLGPQIY